MFALQEQSPTRSGASSQLDLSLAEWMSTIFSHNINDRIINVGMGIHNYMDRKITGSEYGQEVSADFANKVYGIEGGPMPLKFDGPINNMEAEMQNQSRRAELSRLAIIESDQHTTLSMKGLGTLAMTIAAAVSHPVDLAMTFFPAIGSEAQAAKLAKIGANVFRVRMLKGLITSEERIAKTIKRFPRVTASVVDAAVGESILQIPNFIASARESGVYDAYREYSGNVGLAGITGGAFRATIESLIKGLPFARDMYMRFSPKEREAAAIKAVNDKLFDNPIKVSEIAHLSDDVITERIKDDLAFAELKAGYRVQEPEVRTQMIEAALARLEKDGNLGRANAVDLENIARGVIEAKVAERNPQQELITSLKKLHDGLMAVGNTEALEAVRKAIANVLGLIYDPSAKAFPTQWRALGKNVFSAQAPKGSGDAKFDWNDFFTNWKPDDEAKTRIRLENAKEDLELAKASLVTRGEKGNPVQINEKFDAALAAYAKALDEMQPWEDLGRRYFPTNSERAAVSGVLEQIHGKRIQELVAKEREKRMREYMAPHRKKYSDVMDRQRKAAAELQKQGRLLSAEAIEKLAITEKPSDANAALIEADVKALSKNMDIDEGSIIDAMNGRADPVKEALLNAKRVEQGKSPIDFFELRKAAADNAYTSVEAEVAAGANCVIENAI